MTARLTRFANETQREILSTPGLERWLIGTQTFASVASQPQYGLPPSIARIIKIYDATNRFALHELSLDTYRTYQPDETLPSGLSTHYVQLGGRPTAVQPDAPSTLYVISTSASDTNTAYLEGIRTGGHPFTASVVMTGLTAAAFSVIDIEEVTKFYLSAAAVGTVTLKDTP